MQQRKRITFYFIWHLMWGMLTAYGFRLWLIDLMDESRNYGFSSFEDIFPYIVIGCVLALVSFLIHRLIRGWKTAISDWETGWRISLIFAGVLVVGWMPLTFIFLIPLLFECFLLLGLDYFWDKRLEEKPKRKHDEI